MIDVTTDGLTLSGTVGWTALLTYATLLAALGFSVLMAWRGHVPLPRNFRRDWRKTSLNIYTVVLVPVWVILFGAVGLTTLSMFANPPEPDTDPLAIRLHYLALVGFVGVLGGIVSLPLSLMRAEANERQTKAAEGQVDTALAQVEVAQQGHVTDRINKAVEGLGAEKTVSRIGRAISKSVSLKDSDETDPMSLTVIEWQKEKLEIADNERVVEFGEWQAFSETVPNLEVRIGAIYALERIAQDSDRDHIRIMEILCAYIRENAPASLAVPFPEEWVALFEKCELEVKERLPSRSSILGWAWDLRKPRTDIQVALEVIGRRTEKQIALERVASVRGSKVGYRLDLRGTCLQGADMAQMNFDHVQLTGAQLQGAILERAQLQNADLSGAQLQGADLHGIHMQEAILDDAQFQGAFLHRAQASYASFFESQLQSADLECAYLSNAIVSGAQLQNARLVNAELNGAMLAETQLKRANLSHAQLLGASLFDAQLQGTDLEGVSLRRAHLAGVRLDISTSLIGVDFKGAALRLVNCELAQFSQDQIDDAFGDASVTLGDLTKPAHWDQGDEPLDWEEFKGKWHAHLRSIGMDPDNPK